MIFSKQQAPIIEAERLHKSYEGVDVLHGVNLDVYKNQLTLITGPSGSGKTTLLNIISGLEKPDQGEVFHGATNLSAMNQEELTAWRAEHTGFAFQRSALLGGLTAAQNILTPHNLTGREIERRWAGELCARLGIEGILSNKAANLSGGEKQRVAIARALVHKPDVLFADEPSAPLDTAAKVELHEIMREIVDDMGVTIAMVSHDSLSVDYADRVVSLQDGQVLDT